jgi:uncharacterized SAM-binding protein YcdF (DUF218 family)
MEPSLVVSGMRDQIVESAQLIWDYHQLGHSIGSADLIFVLGSHDPRVAERAAGLYMDGVAPRILMSGGFGNFTRGTFEKPEADLFAEIAISKGVPSEHILIENRSTNTGENVLFSKRLLVDRGLEVQSLVAVQKPYMERRTYATIRKQWPDVRVSVTSPQLSFDAYCGPGFPVERIIHIMVGDLHRIMTYPSKGFQILQEIPEGVEAAYQYLLSEGFDSHLA